MRRDDWEALKPLFAGLRPGWPTAAVLAFDLAALTASLYLLARGGIACSLASLALLTIALLHAYLMLHEATHSAVSADRRVNDWVGHFCGWAILMPFLPRQRSHLLHHMWTGHPSGDPANRRIIRRFSVMTEEQANRLEWIWRSWLPLLTLNDRIGLWRDPFQQLKNGAKSRRFAQEIRSIRISAWAYALALAGLAAFGVLGAFLAWYLPALVLLLFLEELANLPHHAETPLLGEGDKALPYWEQDRVTHSCRSVPVWSRLVLLNFNHHVAHHLFPGVPWHGLPQVSRVIRSEAVQERQTPSELAWSLANRRRPLLEIMGHYFDDTPGRRA